MKTIKLTSFKQIKSYDKVGKGNKAYTSYLVEIGYEGEKRSGFIFENQLPMLFEGAEITIEESENVKDGKTYKNFQLVTEKKEKESKELDWKDNIVAKIKSLEARIEKMEKGRQGVEVINNNTGNTPVNTGLPEEDNLPFK